MPATGEFYRDKSGGLYQVLLTAVNTIDRGRMVVYQELKGEYTVYALAEELFLAGYTKSGVQPDAGEKESVSSRTAAVGERTKALGEAAVVLEKAVEERPDQAVHTGLLEFLDARSYQEKLEILRGMRNQLDEQALNGIGVCLDIAVDDKSMEEKYAVIVNYLKTQIRFEDRRLR
ncbi:MAG: hypothetical protein J6B85_01995 [Lachnospiraceae bacterium]|nr:hypothetical protein [Lachnospiraceae bacterium]